jgi:1-phosphatidylinositol-4-phosphate 5-kinase
MRRQPTQGKGSKSPEAVAMRNAMHARDPKRLLEDAGGLDGQDAAERSHFVFYQDDGGLRATDEANAPLDTIYYLGVIDILTPYSTKKKLENIWKGLKADRVRCLVCSGSGRAHHAPCRAA